MPWDDACHQQSTRRECAGRAHEIEHLALDDEVVQAVHDLFHRRVQVPEMEVEDVEVVGLQILETGVEAEPEGFEVVPDVVDVLADGRVGTFGVVGVLE